MTMTSNVVKIQKGDRDRSREEQIKRRFVRSSRTSGHLGRSGFF